MARTATPPTRQLPTVDQGVEQPRSLGWPLALSAWSLLYVLPHLYWAVGGEGLLFMVKRSAAGTGVPSTGPPRWS